MTLARALLCLAVLTGAGCKPAPPKQLGGHARALEPGGRFVDPVDASTCTRSAGTEVAVYEERNFYFCSERTWRAFVARPSTYAFR